MGCVCGKPSAIEDVRETPAPPPPGVVVVSASVVERKKQVSGPSAEHRRWAARERERQQQVYALRPYGGVAKGAEGEQVAAGWPPLLAANAEEAVRGWVPSAIEDVRETPAPLPPGAEKKKQVSGPIAEHRRWAARERERLQQVYALRPYGGMLKGVEGEQVAAGWPPWLAANAGEVVRGWVPRRADSFEMLDKIGQGTYSNVYRARDLDNDKIVALKKVRFDNMEPESVRFMAREIHILRRLDNPNIVKLEGLVTSQMSSSLYLVFEYMEHDLAGLASSPGPKFTEPQIKCYMQQLLRGLDHCHSRGILHRDIKGSNLLVDNNGILKIADFGLASFFDPEQSHPLTSRVVTLWYRPPELLLGATNYGVSVDLWSTGCILAELYAGRPIMPGRTEVEQLHKIFKLCGSPSEGYWRKSKLPNATIFKPQQPYPRRVAETFKDSPPSALALMEILLSVDPADRGTAASALESEFFTSKPLACDPSSLPKYPPSKEFNAKLRDEEARRQRAAGGKVQRLDLEKRGLRESRAIPAPDANAELALSLQKRQDQAGSMSRSEMFSTNREEVASGLQMETLRPAPLLEVSEDSYSHYPHRSSHSGPLIIRNQWKARRNEDGAQKVSVGDLSTMAGALAMRRNPLWEDGNQKIGARLEAATTSGRLSESRDEPSGPSNQKEYERSINFDQHTQQGYGLRGNKIHFSGPLLRPSGNVDQMLKDHDRQIQEVIRRSRIDKSKARKVHGEGNQTGIKPFELGVVPLYPSSRGFPIFTSSRGEVQ